LVSFIHQLPRMSPQQYKAAIASAPEDHEEMMELMARDRKPSDGDPMK